MTMCGPGGAVTPSGWQKLVVSMIERHLRNIGMGEQELLDRLGMSWILLSTHITIMRRVRLGEHLTARTRNSGTTPPIFRRDYDLSVRTAPAPPSEHHIRHFSLSVTANSAPTAR